jgi:LmbE family N-acetylglucosaminyl deacetylase
VAPHPDDEVIGVGGQFLCAPDLWIVNATDGSPRNMQDARAYGFERREDYARARRRELEAALCLAGIGAERALSLGFVDQETAFHLPELVHELYALLQKLRPQLILTPAYEGGHPDHDSVAFAVHAAHRIAARSADADPALVEYALYHAYEGGIRTGAFLPNSNGPNSNGPVETIALSPTVAGLKRRMMDCFATQQRTLAPFSCTRECFRRAPEYDFTAQPHAGRLYYEHFPWGVNGEEWRALARRAMETPARPTVSHDFV